MTQLLQGTKHLATQGDANLCVCVCVCATHGRQGGFFHTAQTPFTLQGCRQHGQNQDFKGLYRLKM